MSQRLYYDDAYTTRFSACIVESDSQVGRSALVLDKTYFYPESGGQPADRGMLGGLAVVDVQIRPSDGAILHFVEGNLPVGSDIEGEIAWSLRLDHMQQHTGQHMLSQAFLRLCNAPTLSFHLGRETSTIDLDEALIDQSAIEEAETLVNNLIWEDRPVRAYMVSREEAASLDIRKLPDIDDDQLRLVEIEDFDLIACGGTHVRSTGGIGQLKVIRLERRNQQLRIGFVCGRRALADYRQKHEIISQLTGELTTSAEDLSGNIGKMQEALKQNQKQVRTLQERLLAVEADTLLSRAGFTGGSPLVVVEVFEDRDVDQLRILANLVTAVPGAVALFGVSGRSTRLLFARGEEAPGEMDVLLRAAFKTLGAGSGGGSATFAQGGGPASTRAELQAALEIARTNLIT